MQLPNPVKSPKSFGLLAVLFAGLFVAAMFVVNVIAAFIPAVRRIVKADGTGIATIDDAGRKLKLTG